MAKDQDPEHRLSAAPGARRAVHGLLATTLLLATVSIQTASSSANEGGARAGDPASGSSPAQDRTLRPTAALIAPDLDGPDGVSPGSNDDPPRQAGPHPPTG